MRQFLVANQNQSLPNKTCMMQKHAAAQNPIQLICKNPSCTASMRLMCTECLRDYHSQCSLQYWTYEDVKSELQQQRDNMPLEVMQKLTTLIKYAREGVERFKNISDCASQFLASLSAKGIEIDPSDPQFWTKAEEQLIGKLLGGATARKITEKVTHYQEQVQLAISWCPVIKQGTFIEENQFHSSLSEKGDYDLSLKTGKWRIFNAQEKEIGGGTYTAGNKTGKWIEPNMHHLCYHEMGTYQSNGLRNGEWKIVQDQDKQTYGGGKYLNGVKVGHWNEPNPQYFDCGNYSATGKRVGEWKINHIHDTSIDFLGGAYNGQGLKIGQWSELNEEIEGCKYFNKGSYGQDGLKNGLWCFVEIEYRTNIVKSGEYVNGAKRGEWFEPNKYSKQVLQLLASILIEVCIKTVIEMVIGQQQTQCKIISKTNIILSYGGGKYVNKLKIGQWTEPNATNDKYKDRGVYNQQSQRADVWIISDIDDKKYGGGTYQNGEKHGNWIEPHASKKYFEQENYKNQIRDGEWIIFEAQPANSQNAKKIFGKGIYQRGEKQGKWIEPTEQVNIFETCSYSEGEKLREDIQRNPKVQLN